MQVIVLRIAGLVLTGVILSSCVVTIGEPFNDGEYEYEPPIYKWGSYQKFVYQMYAEPDKATPGQQIAELTELIAEAEIDSNAAVGPGLYAHLGYMHQLNGDADLALIAYEQERSLYPASSQFLDRMIQQIRGENVDG